MMNINRLQFLLSNQKQHMQISSPQNVDPKQQTLLEFYRSYNPVKEYTDDIQKVLDRVTGCQIETLKQKYHYFFTKLEKQKVQHRKLLNTYSNLSDFIYQSNSVQQQVKGIEFIRMIVKEVKEKMFTVKLKQQIQQQIRNTNAQKVKKLKQQLKSQKDTYFKLKRQEELLLQKISKKEKELNLSQVNQSFNKSAHQNRLRRHISSTHTDFFTPKALKITEKSTMQRQIYESIDFIQSMKQQVISLAKKTHTQNIPRFTSPNISKFSNKSSNELKKTLKACSKTIQLQKIPFVNQYENCRKMYFGIQVFKRKKHFQDDDLLIDQRCKTTFDAADDQKQKFRHLKSQEIFQMILKQGRIQQLVNLINKEKKLFIEANIQVK